MRIEGSPSPAVMPIEELSFKEQCKAALHSFDEDTIEMIVGTAEDLDEAGELDIGVIVPLLRKALDTNNLDVLDVFFDSKLKKHFCIQQEDLIVKMNENGKAYCLYGIDLSLIPDSIPRIGQDSFWRLDCVPPSRL